MLARSANARRVPTTILDRRGSSADAGWPTSTSVARLHHTDRPRNIGAGRRPLALYDDLSATKTRGSFASLYGLASEQQTRASERAALDRVGPSPTGARDRVKAFSGGMKRRLNLAAALLHDPPIVLLDEPTAGVDPQSRSAILDEVRALAAKSWEGVIYTTHYMEAQAGLRSRRDRRPRETHRDGNGRRSAKHGGASTITVQSGEQATRFESADPVADLSRRLSDPGVTNVRIDRPRSRKCLHAPTGRRASSATHEQPTPEPQFAIVPGDIRLLRCGSRQLLRVLLPLIIAVFSV